MSRHITENIPKFKELILYISQNCANDPTFGSIKLNKILFFADFTAFAYYGNPITGMEYQKLERGPAPRRLLPVRQQMIKDGDLGLQELPIGSVVQQRPVNLRLPNLDVFTAKEIALVDSVIKALAGHSAKQTSELTHIMSCWKFAALGETIPYEMVFLHQEPLTERDIARGREIAKEHDLLEPAKI